VALLEKRGFLYNHSGDFPQVILIVPSHVPNTYYIVRLGIFSVEIIHPSFSYMSATLYKCILKKIQVFVSKCASTPIFVPSGGFIISAGKMFYSYKTIQKVPPQAVIRPVYTNSLSDIIL
jgi:hypothetical protein